MSSSDPAIPEPPREPRWRTCLARRWIAGLFGGMLTTIGLVTLALALRTAGGSALGDTVLDTGAWTALGEVEAVDEVERGHQDKVWRIRYRFTVGTGEVRGVSYTDRRGPDLRAGSQCTVEYSKADPSTSRIEGTKAALLDPTASTLAAVLLSLGILGLYVWLRAGLRLRIALRDGRLTTAQIIEAKLLRHVNPNQVSVRYRFQDALGAEQIAGHWVGARSPLGRWLVTAEPREAPVVHDEGDASISRLVHKTDFLASAGAAT